MGRGSEIIICKAFLLFLTPKVKWLLRHPPYFRWLVSSRFLRSVDTYYCDYLKFCGFSFVLESPYRLWPTHLSSAESIVTDYFWNLIRGTTHKLHIYTMAYLFVFQEEGQYTSRRLFTGAALLWSLFYRLFAFGSADHVLRCWIQYIKGVFTSGLTLLLVLIVRIFYCKNDRIKYKALTLTQMNTDGTGFCTCKEPLNRIPLKSYHCRPKGRRTIGRPKKRRREQL